jgi:predicted nucleic acid-binding protein
MSGKFFLDTNIFIYSFDHAARKKAAQAKQLIRDALNTQKGLTSYQVAQEFFNVALKRFTRPMRTAEAEQYLATVFRPLVAVQSSIALSHEALRLHGQGGVSWFDSLIVAGALQAGCDVIYTEDLQHGQKFGGLRVVNPFL